MKRSKRKIKCRRGMAMLIVLFIIMAIAIISSGFIARSDAALLCGYNFSTQAQTDALVFAGLEHARALIVSPENAVPLNGWSGTGLQLEAGSLYYDLSIGVPLEDVTEPTLPKYTYPISCSAYKQTGSDVLTRSLINATLFYDPNSTQAYYISLRRQ